MFVSCIDLTFDLKFEVTVIWIAGHDSDLIVVLALLDLSLIAVQGRKETELYPWIH